MPWVAPPSSTADAGAGHSGYWAGSSASAPRHLFEEPPTVACNEAAARAFATVAEQRDTTLNELAEAALRDAIEALSSDSR